MSRTLRQMIKIVNGIVRNPAWRMAEPVNLEIMEGEQIAICGDNAAGKSRLVEILTQHYPLLQNEVQFDFETEIRKVDEVTGVKRLVCEQIKYITFRDSYGDQDGQYYLQQRWNQHTIEDDMPTVGELLERIPEQRNGLRKELYGTFGLDLLLDKYIVALSSGELRKFQLIKTLLSNPRVLIMDNPFIGLDAKMRSLLHDFLEKITRETNLLIILVLSKYDDIPTFVTHVIEVRDMVVMPKVRREDFDYGVRAAQDSDRGVARLQQSCSKVSKDGLGELSDSEKILDFHNVTIRYGARTILKDLNWTVRRGEFWALSGENGSGKSTLLSLVCADNPQAYACDIELFGHKRGSGESIWDIKKHIGYVSPEMHRAYMKDMPAIDIVASGLSDSIGLYHRPKNCEKEQCMAWMEIFGIGHIADRTFLKLSSGEQRLCLLARAFVKDPELLILDEPMHGLDLKNRQMVKGIIDRFCSDAKKTMVMVTHYEEELPDCITHKLYLTRN